MTIDIKQGVQARLLDVMDRKHHFAWPSFTRAGLTRAQLLSHFRHEYWTYVRDFPVLLARILGQGPPADVRAALAENIFEEQTGKLSFGVSHPELFLEMMQGLGFSRDDLERTEPALEPEATKYRALLDRESSRSPWVIGAAVVTIFVEGSIHERQEIEGRREEKPLEEAIRNHPMVVHYGCPPERMRLARAHRAVEGGHRVDAWRMVLGNIADASQGHEVVRAVEGALAAWLAYRDGVARSMGIVRGA